MFGCNAVFFRVPSGFFACVSAVLNVSDLHCMCLSEIFSFGFLNFSFFSSSVLLQCCNVTEFSFSLVACRCEVSIVFTYLVLILHVVEFSCFF